LLSLKKFSIFILNFVFQIENFFHSQLQGITINQEMLGLAISVVNPILINALKETFYSKFLSVYN